MRKVFLENLPKDSRNRVLWSKSVGYKVAFIYEELCGNIEIIGYNPNNKKITVSHNGIKTDMATGHFINGQLGKVLMKITRDFKLSVLDKLCDNNRNLIIIEREYRDEVGIKTKRKWYKYLCRKCGHEDWNIESNLIAHKQGCSCCNGKTVIYGINSIHDTAPWMLDLGVDFEEAKKYTCCSNKKIKCVCPYCNATLYKIIYHIYKNKSIFCICSDGFSYSEKFVYSLLNQLGLEFETQLSKSTFEWCNKYRYDFYIPSLNMIIETHGGQHYVESTRGRTLEEEQINDKNKKELALKNGINNYVELNCKESDLNWIKSSILNSKLNDLFDLSMLDWIKCEKVSISSNKVYEICKYWECVRKEKSTNEISQEFKISRPTMIKYLKQGTKLGWCKYKSRIQIKNKEG